MLDGIDFTVMPAGALPAMLHLAVALFASGLVIALMGYGGVAAVIVDAAQILFVLFALLAVGEFILGMCRGAEPAADS